MDVGDIIKKYLEENGFDGLYSPAGDCACENSDLFPCCESPTNCKPGHKLPCDPATCNLDGKCDWHIGEREGIEKK